MNAIRFFRNKKILITGHTGFIGSWLTRWLTSLNADVCGYSLDPPTEPNMFATIDLKERIIDVRGDIRDKQKLSNVIAKFKPEIVFHLAAQPIVLESYNSPYETFETNVMGTVNLLDLLRKVDSVKVVLVMTSDKVYRNNGRGHPYGEKDPLWGKDPYSASKSCQDIVVNSFRESYFTDAGGGISSVRAGNVIGGGDWARHRIIPDLIRGIMNNEVTMIRNPNSVRPWQFVLEPISGMLALAERMWTETKYSGVWNFGPDEMKEITVKELVDKFLEYYGKGSYTIDQQANFREANYLRLNISKAKKELDWHPRFDFESSLRYTVEWYMDYLNGRKNMDLVTMTQIKKYSSRAGNGEWNVG